MSILKMGKLRLRGGSDLPEVTQRGSGTQDVNSVPVVAHRGLSRWGLNVALCIRLLYSTDNLDLCLLPSALLGI